VIAQELENFRPPLVSLCLVCAHVIRQQRLVVGRLLGCPFLFAFPPVSGSQVVVNSAFQQRAQLLSRDSQLQSVDHEDLPPITTMASSPRRIQEGKICDP
jgi:hypothetical protein